MARPRDPQIEERILNAVASLLEEQGYDAITMDAIAERAGVGKPTVYRRYGNKDEVIFALNVHTAVPVEPVDTGTLEGDIRTAAWELARTLQSPSTRAALGPQIGHAIADDKANQLFQERIAGQSDAYMLPMWERGLARGEVDPSLDYIAARTALGTALIFSIVLYRLDISCVDQIVDQWIAGVRPRDLGATG